MVDIAVLQCAACGAPLALGHADTATCGRCGASTEIPAAHRALRDAAGWDDQARRAAEAALHGFDRPPGLPLRALAWLSALPFAAIFILFGVPLFFLDLVLAVKLSAWLADLLGWPGGIDGSPMLLTAMMGLVLWAMTIVPAFLAAYGGRRVTARSLLLAALAARPPQHPGGPASCRSCGAPLTIDAGALVARCDYCAAENALQVAPARLAAAHAQTGSLTRTMQEAAQRDRHERARTRDAIARRLWRATYKTGLAFGLWAIAMFDFSRVQGDEAPGLGIAALVVLTFVLIWLIGTAGNTPDE